MVYLVRGMAPGLLFRFQDSRFLTKQLFIDKVRIGLDTLGMNSKDHAGHSSRIGAAIYKGSRKTRRGLIDHDGSVGKLCLSDLHKDPQEVLAGILGWRQRKVITACYLD